MHVTIEELDQANPEHLWAVGQVSDWTQQIDSVGTASAADILNFPLSLIAFDTDNTDEQTGWRMPAGHLAQVLFERNYHGEALVKLGRHVVNPAEEYQGQHIGGILLDVMLAELQAIPVVQSAFAFVNDRSARLYQSRGAKIAWNVRNPNTMRDVKTGCIHVANVLPAIRRRHRLQSVNTWPAQNIFAANQSVTLVS